MQLIFHRKPGRRLPLLSTALGALSLAFAATAIPATAATAAGPASVVQGRTNTLASFSPTVYSDGLQRQYLVKNGRVYKRTEPNWNTWENITAAFNTVRQGIGEITAFDVELYRDGLHRQFLTRGGHVYRRIQTGVDQWGAWENIDAAFPGTGSEPISSFSVAVYADGLQRQFVVRGGQVFRRTQTASGGWPAWEDITSVFSGVGGSESTITAFHVALYSDGKLRQFLTRGDLVYRRTEPNWNTWEDVSSLFDGVGRSSDPRVDEPIHKRVMVIEFNPTIRSMNHQRLSQAKGWYDPRVLEQQYIQFLEQASSQVVQYSIAEHVFVDAFTPRTQNPIYDEATYLGCLAAEPDTCPLENDFDYVSVLRQYGVCEKANAGEIDELWLWGGPYFGYFEANMAGPGAFPTNGDPIPVELTTCEVKLNIMGFNYEREPERMLEDMGHRVEGTMKYRFGRWANTPPDPPPAVFPPDANLLERFTARGFDATTAACGNIHGSLNAPQYDPGNRWGYDFTNGHYEYNTCDDWENYPNLSPGATTLNNCTKWGGPRCTFPDGYRTADRGWHLYWLGKVPNFVGRHLNVLNNWWWYVMDWDAAAP